MLPASTGERKERDIKRGRPDGRAVEIQRLIGRSLRAIVDLEALGERSVYVDCDVLQADGGTRCASITGGYVALRRGARRADRGGRARPQPAHRLDRRGQLRRRRRRGAARPGLLRGLASRGRRQRGDERRRRAGRGAGDGGAHAGLPRLARRSPRPRRAGDRPASRRAGGGGGGSGIAADAGEARRGRHAQRAQAARAARDPRALARAGAAPDEVELPPEDAETFAENALDKARAAHAATGMAAIADDSGIAARALGGRPGVRSARYAGPDATDEENLDLLLERARRQADDRSVAYVCALAYVDERRRRAPVRGALRGKAGRAPRAARAASATTPPSSPPTRGPTTIARWPSSTPPRSTRSATAGGPRGSSPSWLEAGHDRHQVGRRDVQRRLELAPDRAQDRRRARSPARSRSSPRRRTRRSTWSPR